MKKFLKILGILVIFLIVAVIGITIYMKKAFPKVEPPADMKVEITQERLARGKYLANHVMVCIDCHRRVTTNSRAHCSRHRRQRRRGLMRAWAFRHFIRNITPDRQLD
jgi:hypothetical protein